MLRSSDCVPQKLESGEIPEYICLPNGKHYLSREEKKDYQYGGTCPNLCPLEQGSCPNVNGIIDTNEARRYCTSFPNCNFIGNSVLDRMGPNYCVQARTDCINITEDLLKRTDKELTDDPMICNRLGVGCVFNRGNGDGKYTRKGQPTCLRGCLGTKYWNNPEYIWGGGGTPENPFEGSYFNSDLKLGAKYLEAAPSTKNPNGWGGPVGDPYHGHGKLPRSIGIPYTESRGSYVPPCNIKAGDEGVFTSQNTGEDLAGPGCQLTPPRPQYGIQDWSYTCNCPYLGEGGELRSDAWLPCADWELEQDVFSKRNVCEGCYIQDDPNKSLYGYCVLGEEKPDTESKILGCLETPTNSCRVNRQVLPTECPHYCSNNPSDAKAWRPETQCSKWVIKGCWKPNPDYANIISKKDFTEGKQATPYIKMNNDCKRIDTDYLCQNCSQTPVTTVGTGTEYPNRSYCLVGGSEVGTAMSSENYGPNIARSLTCPVTCNQCFSGFFGEPMEPVYKLSEASSDLSAFHKGPIFIPWTGKQSVISM